MPDLIVNDLSGINTEYWDDFVIKHPQGNIFQTSDFYLAFQSDDYNKSVFTALNEASDNRICGIIVAVILKEGDGMAGYFSRRAVIMGSPLVMNNDSSTMYQLISGFTEYLRDKAIYIQFRNMFDMSHFMNIFTSLGYTYEEHLNITIDLLMPEETLWKNVHPKRRNEIRKSEKSGVTIREVYGNDFLREAYRIIEASFTRAKLPVLKYKTFAEVYKRLAVKKIMHLYVAMYEGKMIGAMAQLSYRDRMYNWYSGADPEYYDKCPNDYMHWKVILLSKNEGYKIFDLGGAGKPGIHYGVRDYKSKFGGRFVNYGRFIRINNHLLYIVGKLLLKVYKIVR